MSLSAHGRMARLLMQAALLLALCVCATQSPHAADSFVQVTEDQNGSTVGITKDQTLAIRLSAQSGTGFSWELARTPSAPVSLAGPSLESVEPRGRPGGPTAYLFLFKPTAAGSGNIELGYRRPWEKDTPPARTFTVHVVVRDAAP
jgi:inhibitor of cysteine peptidase